ncbi:hypothetical protein DRF57_19530 [Chryseobacterium rhizosphaerae]|uniref:Uncharacterized protein n=2 Tax=Chryseobacterium rhizosphaerae TaxID=395937 RepID=A0ABX9IFT9_9FLAO|nr:hypothetical protein DRF57_19530 [Chryseobacterium rhizosphaerae]GEN66164.1 hypothetical protein CRH01_07320 [Chryseobacterium rhizosphaerae]
MNAGNDIYTAKNSSPGYISSLLKEHVLVNATRNYYNLMLGGILCVIMIVLLLPQVHKVVLKLKKRQVPY